MSQVDSRPVVAKAVIALCAATFLMSAAHAGDVPDPIPSTDSTQVPILRDQVDRMTVKVAINGRGPFDFMIDTGAEKTIVSKRVREEADLPAGTAMSVRSVLGVQKTPTVNISSLQLSNRRVNVHNSPVLDSKHIGADGILGLDTLKHQRVTFDFKNDVVNIAPSTLRTDVTEDVSADPTVERVAIPARMRKGNLVLTQSRIKAATVPVVVDTGADVSIGNSQLKRLLKLIGTKEIRDGNMTQVRFAKLTTVTGEEGEVEVAMIDRILVEGMELRDILVAFAPTRLFEHLGYTDRPALLLGMDALRRFDRVEVDFGARKVRFDIPQESRFASDRVLMATRERGQGW